MSIPKNKYKDIAFGTIFRYLHIIKEGTVTTNGVEIIPLPDGYTVAFYRVFQEDPDLAGGRITPVGGYYNTGTDARVVPGEGLVITRYGGGGGGPTSPVTFHYFIYGGDYSDE